MGPLLSFTFEGEPVPYQRYNHAARFRPDVKRYYGYKKELAHALKQEYGYFSWGMPDGLNDYQKGKWIKANRYHLLLKVYRSKNMGDIDNYTKSVMDSMQDAKVLFNDAQVDSIAATKHIDKERPRVEFELWRIED